jgi:hypothetical protein
MGMLLSGKLAPRRVLVFCRTLSPPPFSLLLLLHLSHATRARVWTTTNACHVWRYLPLLRPRMDNGD